MDGIFFYKMSGSGNDFIIVDNRNKTLDEPRLPQLVTGACRRRLSVGADGFILVEPSDRADFKWRFFNPDGSRAEMCGNGARCVSRFAFLLGIAGPRLCFETDVGVVSAEIIEDQVKIKMTDPSAIQLNRRLPRRSGAEITCDVINTGVPHAVVQVPDVEAVDVPALGREIRYHDLFAPAGTNVNFTCPAGDGVVFNRTYERGVEDETLACGTGSAAVALVAAHTRGWPSPIQVHTRSGAVLKVHFDVRDGRFADVHLEGDARLVYRAEMHPEAWRT